MNALVKWVTGTAVVAGAAASLLVPKPGERVDATGVRGRADSILTKYATERDRLIMMRRVVARGEARAIANGLSGVSAGEPLIRIGKGVSPETGAAIARRVRGELEVVKAIPTKYPIAVVVELDTMLAAGGLYTQSLVLPEQAGDPCVMVLRIPRGRNADWSGVANQRVTSTCAFYAAFGQPGARTQQWLTESRAIAARWLQLPVAYENMEIDQRTYSLANYGWSPVIEATMRCRLEILEACEQLVDAEAASQVSYYDAFRGDTIDRSALTTEFPGVDVVKSGGWWEDRRLHLGIVGALATELGPERFGSLWRDPRGLKEAFASQSGRPFAQWVADYVAALLAPRPRGPAIPAFATIVALAIITAAAGLAVTRAPRRMT